MTDATTIQNAAGTNASTTQNHAAPSTCCGGPAPEGADACCARDAEVKSTGGAGCGCGSTPAAPTPKKTGCCG
jgi:hypothetical protein